MKEVEAERGKGWHMMPLRLPQDPALHKRRKEKERERDTHTHTQRDREREGETERGVEEERVIE